MTISMRTIAAIALCGLAAQGCVAAALGGAAAGAGAVAYQKGEFRSVYKAPLDRTADATESALRALDLTVDRRLQVAPDQTRIDAHKPDGTAVTVALTPSAPDSTIARIRVGMLGDEGLSRMIDRRIAENLGIS